MPMTLVLLMVFEISVAMAIGFIVVRVAEHRLKKETGNAYKKI
jgi:hypothetical protein